MIHAVHEIESFQYKEKRLWATQPETMVGFAKEDEEAEADVPCGGLSKAFLLLSNGPAPPFLFLSASLFLFLLALAVLLGIA